VTQRGAFVGVAICVALALLLDGAAALAGTGIMRHCEREAVALGANTTIYARPNARSPVAATRPKGGFVYRCETRGAWRRLVFPRPGERVDCSRRAAARPCASGWTPKGAPFEIVD
jgi:hypothetical protein